MLDNWVSLAFGLSVEKSIGPIILVLKSHSVSLRSFKEEQVWLLMIHSHVICPVWPCSSFPCQERPSQATTILNSSDSMAPSSLWHHFMNQHPSGLWCNIRPFSNPPPALQFTLAKHAACSDSYSIRPPLICLSFCGHIIWPTIWSSWSCMKESGNMHRAFKNTPVV